MNTTSSNKIIGKATFKPNLPSHIYYQLIKPNDDMEVITPQQILQRKNWDIPHSLFGKDKWSELFGYMQQSNCEILCLQYNNQQSIMKMICVPLYNDLKILIINGNWVNNIEPLSFIMTINLQSLYLEDNCINQVKPLNKLNCPQLGCVSLARNRIPSCNKIRIRLSKRKQTDQAKNFFSRQVWQDLTHMTKLQIQTISQMGYLFPSLFVNGKARIKQTKVQSILDKRFIREKK